MRNVLTSKTPAIGRSVAAAFVIKEGDVFLVANQNGEIPMEGPHGFGLYYHDCRYLSGYVLEIDGCEPIPLVSSAPDGFKGIVELTTPQIAQDGQTLTQHEVAVRWDRLIEGERRALHDVLRVRNFTREHIELTFKISFRADFSDLFTVRGLSTERSGVLASPCCRGDCLSFSCDGADGLTRTIDVQYWRHPDSVEGSCARFVLALGPDAEQEIGCSIFLGERSKHAKRENGNGKHGGPPDLAAIAQAQRAFAARHHGHLSFTTDYPPLERALRRSLRDLGMLRSDLEGQAFYAAGVPWFVALFGRDSILTALQTLAFDANIARETLRLLARFQGKSVDGSRDEEPGKILHEYRVGELAHIGAIPHSPYYGTVDATPLFLLLVARHAAWTGRLDLFHELRRNIDAALAWMNDYGQSKAGYLEYRSPASGGLANQGWKDSGDAIMMENGDLAKQPIALVEVQGYMYMAKRAMAGLFERTGERAIASALRREAAALAERFCKDFWLEDKGFFALARTANGPAAVLSSNPGHALWAGIADPERAARMRDKLLSDAMWTGWGIRTLSKEAARYNPVAYHRGTVWPHDNAILAAGFRRYGFDDAACRVFQGILDASTHFPLRRLPELFSGFHRDDYGVPVSYPVACHPQAWAAASIPFMLDRMLGLTPEAFEHRLRIVRPILPETIGKLSIRGIRLGTSSIDLEFEREPSGRAKVRVLANPGGLDVKVEPEGTDLE